ncbi:MAG: hypothetical protein NC121_12795 [Blautia sp.]|nr:hypothetical protein [Blautia sp.]
MSAPASNKKYSLEEIREGMKIQDRSQLDNIYDTWIIMYKNPGDTEYIIGFIGTETNSRSDALYDKGYTICPVYNDSIDISGDVYYEE